MTGESGFWDDAAKAGKVMNQIKRLKASVEPWKALMAQIDDVQALYDLSVESNDQSEEGEIRAQLEEAQKAYERESRMSL